jgi:hypothetical protein
METTTPESESATSPTEQTQPDVTLPPQWEVIDSNDQIPVADQHDTPSIVLTHTGKAYTAELYLRTEAIFGPYIDDPTPEVNGLGKWDITYVDPDGVPRDGLTEFYDDPQAALKDFTSFIRTRAWERRCSDG